MSWAALAWAGRCKPGSASRKLVLLALADRHNEEADGSYPSVAWLVGFTDLNRKTVINALNELEAGGFISDSGDRRGDTRQIKLYRLHLETVPELEQSRKRNSSENGAKQSQKRDTDTVRTRVPKKDKPSLGKRPRKPATPFPENFAPVMSGKTASVVAGWPPGRLEDELEQFADHHTAKGTFSHDWQANWRTWVRFSKKWDMQNGRHDASRGTGSDPLVAAYRDALEAERTAGDQADNPGAGFAIPPDEPRRIGSAYGQAGGVDFGLC